MAGWKGHRPTVGLVRRGSLQERLKALLEGQTIQQVSLVGGVLSLRLRSGRSFELRVEEGFEELEESAADA